MKSNKLSVVAISLLMFSILFITCENSKKRINGVNNAKSDTTLYAGTGEFLAHPYGIDTFFLDTVKSIKFGVDSILFITSQMEFDYKDATNASHLQILEYHFL